MTFKKYYYLINLNTRRSSVATHIRRENFVLEPAACVFLGEISREQVVMYQRYALLKVRLRILGREGCESVLSRCINISQSQIDEIIAEAKSDNLIDDKKMAPLNEEKKEVVIAKPITIEQTAQSDSGKFSEVELDMKRNLTNNETEPLAKKSVSDKQNPPAEVEPHDNKIEDSADFVSTTDSGTQTDILEVDVEKVAEKDDLNKMSHGQLRDFAHSLHIKFKGNPSRENLIRMILAKQK